MSSTTFHVDSFQVAVGPGISVSWGGADVAVQGSVSCIGGEQRLTAYSRCADLGIGAGSPFPLAGCEAERGLVFVSAVGAAGPQPKVVQTIPREVAGTEPLIVNPCLDDGDVETPPAAAGDPGYAAGRVWQFGPDRSLVYRELLSGVWGTRVGIHASHLPMLILLPAGRLVTSEPTGAVVEEVYVLDSGALVAGAC